MKLRPTDKHVYAFTQHERDTVVIALKSMIEDEADSDRGSKHAITAGHILDRFWREEGTV